MHPSKKNHIEKKFVRYTTWAIGLANKIQIYFVEFEINKKKLSVKRLFTEARHRPAGRDQTKTKLSIITLAENPKELTVFECLSVDDVEK